MEQDIFCYYKNVFKYKKYKISKQFLKQYLFNFFLTKKAFLEIDPIHISCVSWDEYDTEIIIIASKLVSSKTDISTMTKIIYNVLYKYFYFEDKNCARKMARHILKNKKVYRNSFSFDRELKKLKKNYYKEMKILEKQMEIN